MRKLSENTTPIGLSQAKDALRLLMATEKLTKVRQTPLLLGPPGQGKTSIVDELVDDLNMERFLAFKAAIDAGKGEEEAEKIAGPEWVQVSYRLAQCDPTDLKGVPVYINVDGAEMCSFAPPQIFPMVGMPKSANGKRVIIFLDELPQANPTIQNLAANIIDGKVGDYTIDMDRSFVICAGNRREDHAATYEIPRNVGNRLIRFSVRTGFGEWESWAMNKGVHPMVIGYLKDKQSFFNEPPPEDGYVYGTPRSWHKLSCQMHQLGNEWFDDKSLSQYMAQGTIGTASAIAFFQFAKAAKNQFSVDHIMKGIKVKVPTDEQRDILYSLVLEATYRINSWVADVVGMPKYKAASDLKTKTELFVQLLGKDRVAGISNMYIWLTQKGIDPAFQVLINKYQSQEAKDHFRLPLTTHPDFAKAGEAYIEINKKLLSIK